ncbi:hypothetical protein [Magnetospirillum sp. XM-1]|uniref:hypothetical protein n=1 Tax=Magnetospirillum sp. XM-1 TaxID=1663591 RepID=UPI000837F0DF|nr:hypothetical protein [Magnetospirillum sp. XM-1]
MLFGIAMGAVVGLTFGHYIPFGDSEKVAAWVQAVGSICNSEKVAAWVQAIGTLLALVVAIVVPWWQHKKIEEERKREDFLRGRVIAITILPEIVDLYDRLIKLKNASIKIVASGDANRFLEFGKFTISRPQKISERLDSMYLLGDAGDPVLALMARLDLYAIQQQRTINSVAVSNDAAKALSTMLIQMFEMAEKAFSQVSAFR